jgi:hypothetical protein
MRARICDRWTCSLWQCGRQRIHPILPVRLQILGGIVLTGASGQACRRRYADHIGALQQDPLKWCVVQWYDNSHGVEAVGVCL